MKEITTFGQEELKVIEAIKYLLDEDNKDHEIQLLNNNIFSLQTLTKSISLYPSILGEQHLNLNTRTIDSLITTICLNDPIDFILHIPTKAILGKSFIIAKINFFYMMLYMIQENFKDSHIDISSIKTSICNIISNNIYSIIAEEVFLAILSDKSIPITIQKSSAYWLSQIWEHRMEHGIKSFTPILNKLWEIRQTMKPVFGTLLGLSEIFLLSEHHDNHWLNFLQRDELSEEEVDSLKEFIFGISYEEMTYLINRMNYMDKSSLSDEEISKFLGDKKVYPDFHLDDARNFFKFFQHRKNKALFRQKTQILGPKKTIEEYLMIYLLSQKTYGKTTLSRT